MLLHGKPTGVAEARYSNNAHNLPGHRARPLASSQRFQPRPHLSFLTSCRSGKKKMSMIVQFDNETCCAGSKVRQVLHSRARSRRGGTYEQASRCKEWMRWSGWEHTSTMEWSAADATLPTSRHSADGRAGVWHPSPYLDAAPDIMAVQMTVIKDSSSSRWLCFF